MNSERTVKGVLGTKLGMTQLWDANNKIVPVTVIQAGPCVVTQVRTPDTDGYSAVQLGFGDIAEKKLTKPAKGHFAKAGVSAKKNLHEFRLEGSGAMNVGDVLKADVFAEGDKVDVTGISKGKGYAGVIKRFNAHRLKETHGTGPVRRHAGTISTNSDPSRRLRG